MIKILESIAQTPAEHSTQVYTHQEQFSTTPALLVPNQPTHKQKPGRSSGKSRRLLLMLDYELVSSTDLVSESIYL